MPLERSAFPPILAQAHEWVRSRLRPGDLAIDATVGKGHDTGFLAGCVGPQGKVFGFDVQPLALTLAARNLEESGLHDRVELLERGHEEISTWFAQREETPRPAAAMFNLGYLPGGDRAVITRPETTLSALQAALELVRPGGIITVVAYPGHAGGQAEMDAVVQWARSIPAAAAVVVCYQFLNCAKPSPWLVAIETRDRTGPEAQDGPRVREQ